MIAKGHIDDNVFSLYLRAETWEDAQLIHKAAKSALKPVVSFGHIDTEGLWAWFKIPLKKKNYSGFGNRKGK